MTKGKEIHKAVQPVKRMGRLTYVRLCFSGVLAGTSVVGGVVPLLGVAASFQAHLFGAVLGGLAVAIGFKLTRMV